MKIICLSQDRRERLGAEQGAIRTFLFGEPQDNYERAKRDLTLEIGFAPV